MGLTLSVPAMSAQPDPSVEIRPVYAREWIESLPYANPLNLVTALHRALAALNRSPMKPVLRLELLELYLKPYGYLMELEEKQGPVHSIAGLEKNRAGTDATKNIAHELALGYKLVLLGALQQKKRLWGKNREVAVALQRATLFLSHVLLHAYHEYLPTPPRVWLELAQLHAYGMENEQGEVRPPKAEIDGSLQCTLAEAYKRILLTSLVDPYHLAYGDVWKIYRLLGDCAGDAGLSPLHTVDQPAGIFVIEPASDSRPRAFVDYEAGSLDGNVLLLDANPLVQRFKGRLESSDKSVEPSGAGTESFLKYMIRSWGLPPQRHTPRRGSDGQIRLLTGLSNLYYLLGGTATELDGSSSFGSRDLDHVFDTKQEAETLDVISVKSGGVVTVSASHWGGEEEGKRPLQRRPQAQEKKPAARPPLSPDSFSAEYWELVNQGPGGLGIVKHIRPNYAIGVGGTIGIQFPGKAGQEGRWALGAVRWLSIADSGEYQAGVQLLSPRATPVAVRATSAFGQGASLRAGLALPDLDGGSESSLISPRGTYRKGGVLVVETGEQVLKLRMESLEETTGSYDRYTFTLLGEMDAGE